MARVTFYPVDIDGSKTIMLGKIPSLVTPYTKYLIRTEKDGLYSVYISENNGYSGRLLPRVSTETAESCYHESVEAAKAWIVEREAEANA